MSRQLRKLKRVMWRLRETIKARAGEASQLVSKVEIEHAIILECGVSKPTLWMNRRALMKLGWIEYSGGTKYRVSGRDLV